MSRQMLAAQIGERLVSQGGKDGCKPIVKKGFGPERHEELT